MDTLGHLERVFNQCVLLGQYLKLEERTIKVLGQAALLHDIGKVKINTDLLLKKEPLTDKERKYIMMHVLHSAKICKSAGFDNEVVSAVLCHHERFDGKGYYNQMKGENIPYISRIICIVDSYDAMISERPYSRALTQDEAMKEIINNKGTQFDPEIANAFILLLRHHKNSNRQIG